MAETRFDRFTDVELTTLEHVLDYTNTTADLGYFDNEVYDAFRKLFHEIRAAQEARNEGKT